MPFFQYKKQKTKLVEEPPPVVSEEFIGSMAVAEMPGAEVPENPLTVGGGVTDVQAVAGEAPPLRSRTTKPLNWKGLLSGSALFVAIVVPTVALVADPASRFFSLGMLQVMMNEDDKAAESFTKAIEVRKDPVFYKFRANAYSQLEKPNLEGEYNDLLSALQLKIRDYRTLSDAATLAARLGHHDNAVKLSNDLSTFSTGWTKDKQPFLNEAIYNLLLLGENQLASKLPKEEKPTDFHTAVRALVLRETQPDVAKKIADKEFGEYCSFFCYSSRSRGYDGTMVPDILKSLFLLDSKQPKEAASTLAKLRSAPTVDLRGYPILNLLDAWACYEQGDLDKSLKLTEPLLDTHQRRDPLSDFEDLSESIEGLNLRAAAHLLRQHIYLDRNDTKRAEVEQRIYRNLNTPGKVFVPMPYRSWLGQTGAKE